MKALIFVLLFVQLAVCGFVSRPARASAATEATHVSIFIDATDPWSPGQRRAAREGLHSVASELRRGDTWDLYVLSGASRLPQKLGGGTSPGTGRDANGWTEGRAFMERRFKVEVLGRLDSMLAATAGRDSSAISPVLEALWQITTLSEFARASGHRRLVVVSDLIQNTSSFSFYRGEQTLLASTGAPRDPRWRADLAGADVEVLWLLRDRDVALQGPEMLAAYTDYFKACGAASVQFTEVAP